MEFSLVYFSPCQVKLCASVNCNSTKARLFVSASVESQLHNITTPVCLAAVNPTKEFHPLIAPWWVRVSVPKSVTTRHARATYSL